jgi:NTP pyrophosphatase (non-canonical NTP hydrolase)
MDVPMTDLSPLINELKRFRDARDWAKFHNPKDLAISLNLEASELLELFQWKSNDEVDCWLSNEDNKEKLASECADVFSYLLLIADRAKIDLPAAVTKKIALNEQRYRADLAHGKATKYTDL